MENRLDSKVNSFVIMIKRNGEKNYPENIGNMSKLFDLLLCARYIGSAFLWISAFNLKGFDDVLNAPIIFRRIEEPL